ncbi:MyfA/PsaA family fimbrial adhesin [Yersinia proxima]|uniref:MyfA/PsaA family fimbrial adhesin n=1 Tax=Yersinia proxima TaxID=2890316 RepID=UPI000986D823|nr:MyfA/PsaA family fimbrial adhesin [Yersinia proxima]
MNMKKFVKKPLAIAVLMLASSGVVNMAHADESKVVHSQDITGTRTIKQAGGFTVDFEATDNEIVAGQLGADTSAFNLKASDVAEHGGWDVRPIGASADGMMVSASGDKIRLRSHALTWDRDHWYANNKGDLRALFYISAGTVVNAGEYTFTAKVDDYTA